MNDGGKGSARRPSDVPRSVVDENWDRIFGKKKEVIPETEGKDGAIDMSDERNADGR